MTTSMGKPRVGIYLDEKIYEVLTVLAQSETRSVSNMCERLIVEALQGRNLIQVDPNPTPVIVGEEIIAKQEGKNAE